MTESEVAAVASKLWPYFDENTKPFNLIQKTSNSEDKHAWEGQDADPCLEEAAHCVGKSWFSSGADFLQGT